MSWINRKLDIYTMLVAIITILIVFYNSQRKHVRNGMLSLIALEQPQKLKLQGV